jgi:integrase
MAWIERRTGKRGVSYRVSWRDKGGLKHRRFTIAKAAAAFKVSIEGKLQSGGYTDPALGDVTLGEFWKGWWGEKGPDGLRPSTTARYETHGRLYVLPELGGERLNAITVTDVRAMFTRLKNRGLGAPTLEAVHRLLHRLFEVAIDENRIGLNPVRGLKYDRPARRKARFLSAAEVAAIAREVPNLEGVEDPERYRALVFFLSYTGLRVGEASALKVRNLDLIRGRVTVEEAHAEVGGRLVPGETKTGRSRTVPLPTFVREMLVDHLERFGTPSDPESFVFTGPDGGPIRQNAFRSRVLQPAARRAGIDPVPTTHDLRHTAASLMAKQRFTLREAGEILGHSTTAMTARYSHVFDTDLEEKVGRLDDLHREAEGGGEVVPIRPHV